MTEIQIFDTKTPVAQAAIALYLAAGWGEAQDYDAHKWQNVLANSKCITAYDGDCLVGLIRYLTDGFQDTQICECIVLPEYQRKTIGTQMLMRLIELCGHTSIYGSALKNGAEFFAKNGLSQRDAVVTVSRKAA